MSIADPLTTTLSRLDTLDFTAVDFETANGQRGSVCGAGIVQVRGGRIARVEHTLVQPPRGLNHFSPRNIAVHGITFKAVRHAPAWPDVWATLADIAGDDVIVAHNAPFDMSVINAANTACGIDTPPLVPLCTVRLSRLLLPDLPNHQLPTVAAHLGINDFDHHDAGDDALACAQVTIALAQRVGARTATELVAMLPIRRR